MTGVSYLVKILLSVYFSLMLLGNPSALNAQEQEAEVSVSSETVDSEFSDLYGERLTGPGAILDDPLLGILGKTLTEIYAQYGSPQAVSTARGPQEWQDDVVFQYRDFSELYWFQNRVWQIRFTENYRDEFFSIQMGLSQDQVTVLLGEAYWEANGQLIYNCKDYGFPSRLRLIFLNDRLIDAYVYRSDF
jgi:hypothetical protein